MSMNEPTSAPPVVCNLRRHDITKRVTEHIPDDDDGPPLPQRRWDGSDGLVTAALVAGVVRGGLGVVAFVGALLFLPIHFATPILSGISLLMMVTGCTSLMRVSRDDPRAKMVLKAMALLCAITVAVTMLLVVVMGAGAFAPQALPSLPAPTDSTVRFRAK
jgi:MFS superfamily sulfate permease-like transporter